MNNSEICTGGLVLVIPYTTEEEYPVRCTESLASFLDKIRLLKYPLNVYVKAYAINCELKIQNDCNLLPIHFFAAIQCHDLFGYKIIFK